jgi:hypothetical protein
LFILDVSRHQFYIIEIFEILPFIPKKLGKMNERKYETPAKMVYSPSTKSLADMEKNIFIKLKEK